MAIKRQIGPKLWCSIAFTLSRELIKLDFPAPESPITAMFTSTSRHLSMPLEYGI